MISKEEILDFYNTVYADFLSEGGVTPMHFSKYLKDLGPDFFTGLLPPQSSTNEILSVQEEDE